jgi:hypothetical protein
MGENIFLGEFPCKSWGGAGGGDIVKTLPERLFWPFWRSIGRNGTTYCVGNVINISIDIIISDSIIIIIIYNIISIDIYIGVSIRIGNYFVLLCVVLFVL